MRFEFAYETTVQKVPLIRGLLVYGDQCKISSNAATKFQTHSHTQATLAARASASYVESGFAIGLAFTLERWAAASAGSMGHRNQPGLHFGAVGSSKCRQHGAKVSIDLLLYE